MIFFDFRILPGILYIIRQYIDEFKPWEKSLKKIYWRFTGRWFYCIIILEHVKWTIKKLLPRISIKFYAFEYYITISVTWFIFCIIILIKFKTVTYVYLPGRPWASSTSPSTHNFDCYMIYKSWLGRKCCRERALQIWVVLCFKVKPMRKEPWWLIKLCNNYVTINL